MAGNTSTNVVKIEDDSSTHFHKAEPPAPTFWAQSEETAVVWTGRLFCKCLKRSNNPKTGPLPSRHQDGCLLEPNKLSIFNEMAPDRLQIPTCFQSIS